ncbi:hypothetical protein [Halorussus marinus]|uniref:hypothetical protein n=1 Tax=Halorussus marinus TaxID=2505976 RepID=UPI0010925631|nr:hypothetical protein [Halorussus marinus]
MPEERFETETILRGTTVDVERPVEVDGDGAPIETETVELPANERVEAVTCERYPEYCPRRGGLVSVEEAVVVGVDMVDRPTGRDAAVSLAYCPECATSEFAYVRDRDGGADADGRTLHERYGYLFGTEATRERPLKRLDGPGIASSLVVVALGMGLAVLGAQGLMLWAALVAATVAAAARLSDAV